MYVFIHIKTMIHACSIIIRIGYSPGWRQLWAYNTRGTSKVTMAIAHAPWYNFE